MLCGVFSVSEVEAAAIRAAYRQSGELAAAVELRRRFPGIIDNAKAREFACIIAGWKPLPKPPGVSRTAKSKPRNAAE
jgi:hypothetical protein